MSCRVSVVIPVYNRERLACRAVESVLRQTVLPEELIVVDDGSTDDLSLLQELVQSNGGLFVRTTNQGPAAARNKGVFLSSGEWVSFLDSDDVWLGKKLESLFAFAAQINCGLVHSDERWIRNGRFVNPQKKHQKAQGDRAFEQSLELCCISPSAVMLRRELFDAIGGFDEQLRVCEDYDLWIRITAQHQVGFLPDVLIEKHGGHADQLSRSAPAMDRFRVYALAKLLLLDRNLTDVQGEAVFTVLEQKCSVLAAGAMKRAMPERSEYFSLLPDTVRKYRLSKAPEDALGRLRGELLGTW